jgi:FMN phosphatase YigB (HAD superfamily)
MPNRSSIRDKTLTLIPTVRFCSFDIFDTFLLRRCTGPDGVYERACELLSARHSRPLAKEAFIQHRIQAEAKARKKAVETRKCVEIGIGEIYAVFPIKLFGFARENIPALIQAEFDAEISLCYANPEILDLYATMQRENISTGFISDTYWSGEQIRQLLSACCPGLTWDFLFASSDHHTGKAEKLFAVYLTECNLDPRAALHIGDNAIADIKGAEKASIRAIHFPQAEPSQSDIFQSEQFIFNLFCCQPHHSSRLDGGFRTMRRAVDKLSPDKDDAHKLGHHVLGPIMAAFNRFVADRVASLKSDSQKSVAISFLGRDGMLPHNIWQQLQGDSAQYLEINRRVSIVASAQDATPLCDLFKNIPRVDAAAVKAIIKRHPSRIDDYFQGIPGGVTSGAKFAEALPGLIKPAEVAAFAKDMRNELIAYLRQSIPNFDACTDLVLVDLGYAGTVQKALRRAFDLAGIETRLHGVYLLTLDDAISEIADTDSAEGFISDLVTTPHTKRALLRNIPLLELLCASSEGSVRYYRDGAAITESDPRPSEQNALCDTVRAAVRDFAALFSDETLRHGVDPFADSSAAAGWCAAILGRLLMLPMSEELSLFASMKHDINLGTKTTVPLLDSASVRSQEIARGIGGIFTAHDWPAWLSASLGEQSPLHGILYSLFSSGVVPGALLTDRKAGDLEIALISAGNASPAKASYYTTAFGRIRLRIPTTSAMAISTIAIPLGKLGTTGRMTGAVHQSGPTVSAALASQTVAGISPGALTWIDVRHDGACFFDADPDTSYLAMAVPRSNQASQVITIEFEIVDQIAQTIPRHEQAPMVAA